MQPVDDNSFMHLLCRIFFDDLLINYVLIIYFYLCSCKLIGNEIYHKNASSRSLIHQKFSLHIFFTVHRNIKKSLNSRKIFIKFSLGLFCSKIFTARLQTFYGSIEKILMKANSFN